MSERRCYQGEVFERLDPGDRLADAEFDDCVFRSCRWLGLRIENCRFSSCTFDHCILSGVVFSFSVMKDGWLLDSSFRSMAWGGLQGSSRIVQPFGKIRNCAFRYNDFSGMSLNGFDWSSCSFEECTFDSCQLSGASFRTVHLGNSHFTRSDLRKADFRDADGYAVDLATNQLQEARFSFPDVVRLLDGTGIRIE